MPTAVRETIQVLELIVQAVPLGSNIGLLYLLWAMLNGSFLSSRGGIFPALQASGFDAETSRRSWAAFRYGAWTIGELIEVWRRYVLGQGKWQGRRYGGYRVLAVDWTAFWRPQLQGWRGRFFHRLAGRAVKGVGMGVAVEVGEVEGQRLPLLRRLLRIEGEDMSESRLKAETLQWLAKALAKDEIVVMDAGVKVSECQAANIERWVVRLALNATGRRNFLPEDKKRGRPPEYGQVIRPSARTYKGRTLAASQPDVQVSFPWQGRTIQAHGWCNLVLPTLKPDPHHATFSMWLFFDPAYEQPLLLATNVSLAASSVFAIYLDRWPVEQPRPEPVEGVPLAAKQMLGLHRQFVSAPEACQRLPELALLAGNILTYLAAILPPVPTGFWDKHPKKLLAACADFWRKPIFSLGTKNMANFAKRTPPLHTCPRELMPIAAKNAILSPFSHPLLSSC